MVEYGHFDNCLYTNTIEVMDDDWDLLESDTAVLSQRLIMALAKFNKEHLEKIEQDNQIVEDQVH